MCIRDSEDTARDVVEQLALADKAVAIYVRRPLDALREDDAGGAVAAVLDLSLIHI